MNLPLRIFLTIYLAGVVKHVGNGETRNSSRLLDRRWRRLRRCPRLDRPEEEEEGLRLLLELLLGLELAALSLCLRFPPRFRLYRER